MSGKGKQPLKKRSSSKKLLDAIGYTNTKSLPSSSKPAQSFSQSDRSSLSSPLAGSSTSTKTRDSETQLPSGNLSGCNQSTSTVATRSFGTSSEVQSVTSSTDSHSPTNTTSQPLTHVDYQSFTHEASSNRSTDATSAQEVNDPNMASSSSDNNEITNSSSGNTSATDVCTHSRSSTLPAVNQSQSSSSSQLAVRARRPISRSGVSLNGRISGEVIRARFSSLVKSARNLFRRSSHTRDSLQRVSWETNPWFNGATVDTTNSSVRLLLTANRSLLLSAESTNQNTNSLLHKQLIGRHIRAHTSVDYVHYLLPYLRHITECSYYWGIMDRYEAESLLEGKPEGTFLLRDSMQDEFLFSVSFRRYGRSLHARIEQWEHQFSFDSHESAAYKAPSVTELIEHYRDPQTCMFFEPMLMRPLKRRTAFSLQHLARSVICDHLTYDSIDRLNLPKNLQDYLRYYHYKQKLRVRTHENSPQSASTSC